MKTYCIDVCGGFGNDYDWTSSISFAGIVWDLLQSIVSPVSLQDLWSSLFWDSWLNNRVQRSIRWRSQVNYTELVSNTPETCYPSFTTYACPIRYAYTFQLFKFTTRVIAFLDSISRWHFSHGISRFFVINPENGSFVGDNYILAMTSLTRYRLPQWPSDILILKA